MSEISEENSEGEIFTEPIEDDSESLSETEEESYSEDEDEDDEDTNTEDLLEDEDEDEDDEDEDDEDEDEDDEDEDDEDEDEDEDDEDEDEDEDDEDEDEDEDEDDDDEDEDEETELDTEEETNEDAPSEEVVARVMDDITQKAKNGKDLSVQPTTVQQIQDKLDGTPSTLKTEPVEKVKTLKIAKKKVTLDDLLVKTEDESDQFYLMRSQYAKIAEQLFPKYPPTSFILLGRMGAYRGLFGVTYPEETNRVLDYMDQVIKNIP